MIFWFYFTCIKISPRQTISSRPLASTLNLTCANDVTCSYDVIMRSIELDVDAESFALVCVQNILPNVKCLPVFSYKP